MQGGLAISVFSFNWPCCIFLHASVDRVAPIASAFCMNYFHVMHISKGYRLFPLSLGVSLESLGLGVATRSANRHQLRRLFYCGGRNKSCCEPSHGASCTCGCFLVLLSSISQQASFSPRKTIPHFRLRERGRERERCFNSK